MKRPYLMPLGEKKKLIHKDMESFLADLQTWMDEQDDPNDAWQIGFVFMSDDEFATLNEHGGW